MGCRFNNEKRYNIIKEVKRCRLRKRDKVERKRLLGGERDTEKVIRLH